MGVTNACFAVVLLAILGCATKQVPDTSPRWQRLFEDPSTFRYHGETEWSMDKGQICNVLSTGNGFLITNKKYNSFELELEFNPDALVNSGIFIRCKSAEMSFVDCYELNIWDEHPDQSNMTGSIVTRATALNKIHTIGRWNTMKVNAYNNRIQIWINDILTLDYNEAEARSGVIGLQAFEAGSICFRNIRIRAY